MVEVIGSIADVAKELNYRYSQAKRKHQKSEKEGILFAAILKDLFYEYGTRFGYNDELSFRRIVLQTKNNLKKGKKIISVRHHDFVEDFRKVTETVSAFCNSEGIGEEFTDQQIEDEGLDRDQYFPSLLSYQ